MILVLLALISLTLQANDKKLVIKPTQLAHILVFEIENKQSVALFSKFSFTDSRKNPVASFLSELEVTACRIDTVTRTNIKSLIDKPKDEKDVEKFTTDIVDAIEFTDCFQQPGHDFHVLEAFHIDGALTTFQLFPQIMLDQFKKDELSNFNFRLFLKTLDLKPISNDKGKLEVLPPSKTPIFGAPIKFKFFTKTYKETNDEVWKMFEGVRLLHGASNALTNNEVTEYTASLDVEQKQLPSDKGLFDVFDRLRRKIESKKGNMHRIGNWFGGYMGNIKEYNTSVVYALGQLSSGHFKKGKKEKEVLLSSVDIDRLHSNSKQFMTVYNTDSKVIYGLRVAEAHKLGGAAYSSLIKGKIKRVETVESSSSKSESKEQDSSSSKSESKKEDSSSSKSESKEQDSSSSSSSRSESEKRSHHQAKVNPKKRSHHQAKVNLKKKNRHQVEVNPKKKNRHQVEVNPKKKTHQAKVNPRSKIQ